MQVTADVTQNDIERANRSRPFAQAFRPRGGGLRTLLRTLLLCLLAPAAVAAAQDSPLSAGQRWVYGGLKDILLRSAEKMPEEHYGFRPTAAVRSFGQIVGHVADSQYAFCSIVLGQANPAPGVEQTRTAKADLIAALKDAFAYCDRAYEGMTDASAAQTVKFFGAERPKLSVLMVNTAHGTEHYGNLATYLRMKDLVPPTSEPPASPQPRN